MSSPLHGYHLLSTLALSVLLSLSAVKHIEASAALPPLNTFPGSSSSTLSSSASSSSSSSITSYSYTYEPPLPDDQTRAIRLWGSLPATYVGKVAAFGNALTDPFAANLMLPPDDPWLCEFPESLKNITSFATNNPMPYKIALFVSLNGCSPEQKARVALEIRQKVTPRLELLILYSTDPSDDTELVSLQLDPDSPWQGGLNMDGEDNVGILHVPQRYAAGIDVRIRVNTNSQNADPRLGMPTNEDWKLEVEVAPLRTLLDDDGYPPSSRGGDGSGSGSGSSGSYRYDDDFDAGSMYWFRIVLFTLLIVSPCCRAGYLWHAGGGRFHWRRNDNGRIVGVLYVPPVPAWLSTGGMQYQRDTQASKLTIEQFNTLPQIKYMPNPSSSLSHDDGCGDCDDDDIDAPVDENSTDPATNGNDVETNKGESNTMITKNDSSSDVGESPATPDDEFPMLAQNTTEVTEADSMETAEIDLAPAECETDSPESTADALELGDGVAAAELQDKEETKASVPEASASAAAACDTSDNASSANDNADNNIQDECAESCSQTHCPSKFKATTSSMCSICIDDFEEGETLVLLPRCQHAFHKDCILPWLTERQGCCPMCKCNVLEEDDVEEEEEQQGEQARNTSNEDDDSDSTENNTNERVVPPGPPGQSGTP